MFVKNRAYAARARTVVALSLAFGLLATPSDAAVAPAPASSVAPASAPSVGPVSTAPAAVSASAPKSKAKTSELPKVDTNKPGSFLETIISAFKGGNWKLGVSLVIVLLTWLLNLLFKGRIPAKLLPWIAMGAATVANFFFLWSTKTPWYTALFNGLSIGLAAAGGWSAILKYILPTPTPPAKPGA